MDNGDSFYLHADPIDPTPELIAAGFDTWEAFEPTEFAASVWVPTIQHGAPPAALAVRAIERLVGTLAPGPGQLSRVTVDLLGPVPMSQTRVAVRQTRPGSNIGQYVAELWCADRTGQFRAAVRVTAWWAAFSDSSAIARDPEIAHTSEREPKEWNPAAPEAFSPWSGGYLRAVEWSFGKPASSNYGEVFARPLVRLVPDEEPSPLVRVFSIADAANGIAGGIDPEKWRFLNFDMTVHLHRQPEDEKGFELRATATPGPTGTSTTASWLSDSKGCFAQAFQAVLLQPVN